MSQLFLERHAVVAERRQQRATTMGGLLKSIATGVIASIVVFMTVAQLGYNIAPLIASAGIVGVALGFGAQSLVKDFLSGICIILEDQFGVGDIVKVGAAAGTIEAVGLRVTRLRDVDGTVWYVRNGEILAVGNMSQEWASAVLDIPVALSEDLARVRELLADVARTVWEDPAYSAEILEEPEIWGVEQLSRGWPESCESASRNASTRRASTSSPRRRFLDRVDARRGGASPDLRQWGGDNFAGADVLRRRRRSRHVRTDRPCVLPGRRVGSRAASHLPRGRSRTGRGTFPDVPRAVLGRADHVLRHPWSPAARTTAHALRRHPHRPRPVARAYACGTRRGRYVP
jgi:Mechanosensitive ion channel